MVYELNRVFTAMVDRAATSVHLKAKTPVYFRVLDLIEKTSLPVPTNEDLQGLATKILGDAERERLRVKQQVDCVMTLGTPPRRYRVCFFCQRDSTGLVLRPIADKPPTTAEIGLPTFAREVLSKRRGLLLVTGPASSGKTTTVAAILNTWIKELDSHIVTLEDPIEYVLASDRSLVTQRQVGVDTETFASGLRHVLRQDPDIIYVGELSDVETVTIAMAAAETGHLVISTLHTPTAAASVEQIIGMYPPDFQDQVRLRLSVTLQGVLSQVLVPTVDRTRRIAVFEVLTPTEAIRGLIRQNQSFRVAEAMETSANCCTFRIGMAQLVQRGIVAQSQLRRYAGERSFATLG
ncbi:MAG: PilT/PilU family type 4a pilus ATPase [Candidatus Riflebacteria bacterium]|nr:PilT/PilU family type 4a pilus ATPase [Candidatus Riflebacteria bacterium]